MKQTLVLLALILPACGFLSSCTGDPHEGGIFWSERKAQERLAARSARLNDAENANGRVHRRNRQLEGAAARREEALGY
jgi:hypothetical protein